VRCSLRIIIAILLLGAVVNVAVAWSCALWSPLGQSYREVVAQERVLDEAGVSSDLDAVTWHRSGVGLDEFSIKWHVPGEAHGVWVYRSGLPFRSLRCRMELDGDSSWTLIVWAEQDAPFVPPSRPPLPLMPLWLGFAANTGLNAALLLLFAFGPKWVRSFVRQRRGRCIACGYDLRGGSHVRCPECGLVLPSKSGPT
jgi:hypothetical protein